MKNILLVIDVQKGFIISPEAEAVKNHIDRLIADRLFDKVISTVYQNYENSPIIRLMGWNKLLTEDEQQLVGNAKTDCDYIITKNTYSAVNDELFRVLREICDGDLPECVYLAGVDIECCVLATATDLFERGIRPIVLTQYCGTSSGWTHHEAGLFSMQSLIGRCNLYHKTVTSADDLQAAYRTAIADTALGNTAEISAEQTVVDLLLQKGWHISFAESCTGGLATARLVDIPDASRVLCASHVTYANESKIKYLGVSPESIRQYGVVSEQVAKEMAIGTAQNNQAQVGVGISGIAGPSGATDKKPVGMVCFGFYINGTTYTQTIYFGDVGRNRVRHESVSFVYKTLQELLND